RPRYRSYRNRQQPLRQLALEFVCERPGHQNVVIALAPFDEKLSPGKQDDDLSAEDIDAGARYRGGAGGGTAGAGQAGAPLPNLQGHAIMRENLGERDIGTFGKERMMLEHGAEAAEIIGREILHPEDAMRVADVDYGRRVEDRIVDRSHLQFDVAGIAEFLRQRNI